ncbi:hypothetical protein DSCW_48890 [Desulfosarcina widdelii]|uniref:Uncharacterized protein n=1 Tax=Desulfosarcina widdelii TaxID=947919 RepID=A0A5K7Z639_9BACT|nr:hypothetical protein DSCW_48890 [Desulfosarcina widdelii]
MESHVVSPIAGISEKILVGPIINTRKGIKAIRMAVDLDNRKILYCCTIEDFGYFFGTPSDVIRPTFTKLVGYRQDFMNEQTMRIDTLSATTQGKRDRLQTIVREEMGPKLLVMALRQ